MTLRRIYRQNRTTPAGERSVTVRHTSHPLTVAPTRCRAANLAVSTPAFYLLCQSLVTNSPCRPGDKIFVLLWRGFTRWRCPLFVCLFARLSHAMRASAVGRRRPRRFCTAHTTGVPDDSSRDKSPLWNLCQRRGLIRGGHERREWVSATEMRPSTV